MADFKVRLIKDDDPYSDEKALISKKQFPSYGSSHPSTTALSHDTLHDTFVQHQVTQSDTLNSLSLKYGINASAIKRTNKLWNDNIFLCKFLLIPISNTTEYDNKDYQIVSKHDISKGISKSKSAGQVVAVQNNFSAQHNHYNPELNEVRSEDEETLENIDCIRSDDLNQVSANDYFKKFDSSLAEIKKNVEKLEKQNRFRLH